MGNMHRPTNDSAIADSIDFISDTVTVVTVIIITGIIVVVVVVVYSVHVFWCCW